MPCAAHRQQEWEDAQITVPELLPYDPVPTAVTEKRRYRLNNMPPYVMALLDRGKLTDPLVVELPSGNRITLPRAIFEVLYEEVY